MTDDSDNPFLTIAETAELLRVNRRTLDNLRWQDEGPPFRRHGGRIVYHRDELLAWSEQRRARTPSAKGPQEPPAARNRQCSASPFSRSRAPRRALRRFIWNISPSVPPGLYWLITPRHRRAPWRSSACPSRFWRSQTPVATCRPAPSSSRGSLAKSAMSSADMARSLPSMGVPLPTRGAPMRRGGRCRAGVAVTVSMPPRPLSCQLIPAASTAAISVRSTAAMSSAPLYPFGRWHPLAFPAPAADDPADQP